MDYYIDKKDQKISTFIVRLAGLSYFSAVIWNFQWVVSHLNLNSIFSIIVSCLFLFATMLITVSGIVLVINNWNFSLLEPKKLISRKKPEVAVIIPTYSEPIELIINTVKSVANQNWPKSKRVIIISDDGYSDILREAVKKFKLQRGERRIFYHRPHKKGHPERRGEAKAGNLNSTLDWVVKKFPNIEFIETRDADDIVGTDDFLSYCMEVLKNDQELSFVQTIKQSEVDKHDPFSNQEAIFYQRVMPSRNASNATFPCGSGLIWRLSELRRIGGFPAWNLVEDLQSGFEILSLGGKGAFLPIVGAIGQIAPEDIPNFYKQRGTWALDTLRLFYFRNPIFAKGLAPMQKMHFFELEFSYLLSYAMFIFILIISLGLTFKVYPVLSSPLEYFIHFIIFAVILELYNIARSRGISYSQLWRTRQIWLGLMPVFMLASIMALAHGPYKKPAYKVTRKYHEFAWYWKETLPQKLIVGVLAISIVVSVLSGKGDAYMDSVLIFWALFFIYGLSQVIKNSWHGMSFKKAATKQEVEFDLV